MTDPGRVYPTCQHPYCQEPRCETCLEDAFALGQYLRNRCGGRNYDWLSRYRTFMDKRLNRSAETEWGWFDPIIFLPEHLEAFVADWYGEKTE